MLIERKNAVRGGCAQAWMADTPDVHRPGMPNGQDERQCRAPATRLTRSPLLREGNVVTKFSRDFCVLSPEIVQHVASGLPKKDQLELLEVLSRIESSRQLVRSAARTGCIAVVGGLALGVIAVLGATEWMVGVSAIAVAAFCVGYGLVAARGGRLDGVDITQALRLMFERRPDKRSLDRGGE
jgi:hypothetical protein